jgi:hypothetical protein
MTYPSSANDLVIQLLLKQPSEAWVAWVEHHFSLAEINKYTVL